jgi:hypothetical protein
MTTISSAAYAYASSARKARQKHIVDLIAKQPYITKADLIHQFFGERTISTSTHQKFGNTLLDLCNEHLIKYDQITGGYLVVEVN